MSHPARNFSTFLSSADVFQNQLLRKKKIQKYHQISKRLDPDQARHFVGPDLGPICLQRLSAEDI